MARQSRRKQTGVIGTLLVELSALAGFFGIAQPTVRNNLWQILQPPTVNSQLNPAQQFNTAPQLQPAQQVTGNQQTLDQLVPQPEPYVASYVPQAYQPVYPSTYTAQAITPNDARSGGVWNRSAWNRLPWSPAGYNPMGTYQ